MPLTENQCYDIGKETRWSRKCPKCDKELFYSNRKNLLRSTFNNKNCRECYREECKLQRDAVKWSRQCPICSIEIVYKKKSLFVKANKETRSCNKCKYELRKIPVPKSGWVVNVPYAMK